MRGRRRPVTFRVLAAIVFKAHQAFVLVKSDPLAHRALANANGFTDGLQRLRTQDLLDHSLSTKRRQAGILVDVHSALPRIS